MQTNKGEMEKRVTTGSKAITALTGSLVFLVGISVMVGWKIDSSILKTVYPGLVTMKPNTALGLMLSGLTLALLAYGKAGVILRSGVALIAGFVAALGTITLCEYFFGWDAGIDEFLFREAVRSVDTARPGLMAPSTAFCFVLIGTAVGIASRRIIGPLAGSVQSALATVIISIGGVASAGQFSNAIFHVHLWNYFWMAIHTAFSFVLLGFGLLSLAKSRATLTWALDRTSSIGFGAAIIGMLVAACVSWSYANDLKETSAWVSHTHQVLKDIEDVRAGLAELENGQRGYVILGDESVLQTREQIKAEVNSSVQELRRLTSDNTSQQARLGALEPLIAQRTIFGEQAIAFRRQQGFSAAQKWIAEGTGLKLSIQMAQILTSMRESEYALLLVRQKNAEAVSASTFMLQPLCIFLSLTVLSLAAFVLNAGVHRRRVAEESAAQLAAIVNSSSDAIIGADLSGNITSWNRGAERIYGYSAGEMIGQSVSRLIPPDRQEEEVRILRQVKSGHSVEHFETMRVARDGHLVDVSVAVSAIRNDQGEIIGASKVARDISESKRVREALRESESQFSTMVNAIPQLAWMAHADGSIFWYNQRWFDYTGTKSEEMEGWGWQKVHHPDHLPTVMERWKAAIAHGHSFEMEFPLRAADGHYGWFLTLVLPLKDEHGKIVRWFGTNTDVSQKREAEELIRKLNTNLEQRVAERTVELEAINKELEAFSYSVSHDLRAPLRAVDGFSQAVIEDWGPQLPPEGQRYLRTIRESAQRMGALVDDLLAFSRLSRASLNKQDINTTKQVNEIIEELTGQQNGRALDVRVGDLPPCLGAPGLLEQVWVNLLSNAFKYTRQRENAIVEVGCKREAGENVFFVRDNGTGFDMRYANKLFGVFQRLHRADEFEGTGVGLAIVQRILQRHGERIWAEAEVNRGATFYFTLTPAKKLAPAEVSRNGA